MSLNSFLHTVKWFQLLLYNSHNLTSNICLYTIFVWPINWTLLSFSTPDQNDPGSNDNEGALHIPQSSKVRASPSDGLMSYTGHSLMWSYSNAEMQSVYSAAPADWLVCLCGKEIWLKNENWLCEINIEGSHLWVRPCFSNSVPPCLVRLTWMDFEIGGKWPYSFCFMESCRQELFKITRTILMYFPSSIAMRFVSVHMMQLYSSIDTATAWKNIRFILSDRLDFHTTNIRSIAVHTFVRSMLISLSVDEMLCVCVCVNRI